MAKGEAPVRFVGRVAELDALRSLIDDANKGHSGIALIEGEAGIGKSRLLTEALNYAGVGGFAVFKGSCDELDQTRPFGAISEAFDVADDPKDRGRAELAELLSLERERPSASGIAGGRDFVYEVGEALLGLLEEASARTPVALAVEDLQWSDHLTLRAVRNIAKRASPLPLVLLVTARPDPRRAELNRVIDDLLASGAVRLVPAALSDGEAAELTRDLLGFAPGPNLLRQVGGAAGNPLFVIELVQALKDEGAIMSESGRFDVGSPALPPSLRLTILRRLSVLPEETIDVLRIASILGSTFSVGDLATVDGRTAVQLLPALKSAFDAKLLIEVGDRIGFHHDLVREAVYTDLPVTMRKGLHREAGRALAAAGASPERVGNQIVLGAEPGDTPAIEWLTDAGRAATHRSPGLAVRFLERAMELAEIGAERDSIAAELVEPLLWIGRPDDAAGLARDLLARSPSPQTESLLRSGLAGTSSIAGNYAEAVVQLERAAALAASDVYAESQLAAAAYLRLLAGDVEGARSGARRAIRTDRQMTGGYAPALGYQTLALAAFAEDDVAEALTLAERSVTYADRHRLGWANYLVPRLWYGVVLGDADRFEEGESAIQAGLDAADAMGNASWLSAYHWGLASLRFDTGRWDDALVECEAGLAVAEETRNRVGDAYALALLALVALHRGELAHADRSLTQAESRFAAGKLEFGFDWTMWARALIEERQGNPSRALEILKEAWDLAEPLRNFLGASKFMGVDLVRLAMDGGDRAAALSVTSALEACAARSGAPAARAAALRCKGLTEQDPAALKAAVDEYRGGPRLFERARACRDAGVALGKAELMEEAIPLLHEALEVFEGLGAVGDAAATQAELRELGVKRAPRLRKKRPAFGWESLTATELKVVMLTAEGLTNRQIGASLFVSRRTVATHLEHVFQKLGISTRVQVAAEVTRRLPTSP